MPMCMDPFETMVDALMRRGVPGDHAFRAARAISAALDREGWSFVASEWCVPGAVVPTPLRRDTGLLAESDVIIAMARLDDAERAAGLDTT